MTEHRTGFLGFLDVTLPHVTWQKLVLLIIFVFVLKGYLGAEQIMETIRELKECP